MSKKKIHPLKVAKPVKNKAVVQPILEQESPTFISPAPSKPNDTQISDMLEDMHDIIENITNMSSDMVETLSSSMNLTTNLISNIVTGASECLGELINHNSNTADKFLKCSNATEILSFNHGMFDNNFGFFNQCGINLGNHMNDFTKGLSDVISYNLNNNWVEKFKNKKKYS